jgi:hypothetical protein
MVLDKNTSQDEKLHVGDWFSFGACFNKEKQQYEVQEIRQVEAKQKYEKMQVDGEDDVWAVGFGLDYSNPEGILNGIKCFLLYSFTFHFHKTTMPLGICFTITILASWKMLTPKLQCSFVHGKSLVSILSHKNFHQI